MKNKFLLCIAYGFCLSLNAQILTVRDKITHQPIELAIIYCNSPKVSILTDNKGRANISAFRQSDSIYIRYMGYEPILRSYESIMEKRFVLYLIPSDISLDEVVVSASRWKQEKNEVPNRIVSIKPIKIVLENPQTAADLLSSTGEVYIQKSQLGGGSPMIRGFATNRILISVDGVRMNNAIFRSGNLQNVISLDPFAIQSTEVIFGPGSVVYGSDAIGGVMSFYTLTPSLTADSTVHIKGSATTRYSTANNEKTGHIDFNIGIRRWSFVSSFTLSDFDDLRMGAYGPDEYLRPKYADRINGKDSVVVNADPEIQLFSGYSQLNLMQKIRFKANEKLDFNYGFHYSTTTNIPRYDRLIEYRNNKLRDGEWYYGPQKWIMNSMVVTLRADNLLFDNFNTVLACQNFEESRHNRSFGKNLLSHRSENIKAFSLNFDFDKRFDKKLLVNYGGEILVNKVGSVGIDENIESGVSSDGSTRYPDGSTWNSYSLYLTPRYELSDFFTLHSGIRYNLVTLDASFDTTFYPFPFVNTRLSKSALTGSAGLLFKPYSRFFINLNLSTGFRAPNIDDIGKVFDSEPGMITVPNPDLQQEYAYNAELSVNKTFKSFVRFDVSGYYTYLDNAMVRRDFTLNGHDSIIYDGEPSRVQAIQNAANAWVWGLQAGVDIKLPAGFGISARINYQKGMEELDDGSKAPLRHAAPMFGNIHLTYTANRFKTSLYCVYNSEISNNNLAPSEQNKPHLYAVDKDGKPYSPSWYTLNWKALYQLTDFLLISTGIENVTDQRYRTYSSGITAPGKNLIFTVKITF